MAKPPKATSAGPFMRPAHEPELEAAEPEWLDAPKPGKPKLEKSGQGEPPWEDNQDDKQLAAELKNWDRPALIDWLTSHGVTIARAVQFLDLFEEYREATLNIRKHGVVATHKRDCNPMENPYLNRRDKARTALERFRDVEAPQIWRTIA